MNTSPTVTKGTKSPLLILLTVSAWTGLALLVLWPWIHQIDQSNLQFSLLAHINVTIWWIVLLWSLHHLSYQVFSLFKTTKQLQLQSGTGKTPAVAVLYLSCNDFTESSCESCLQQDYGNFELFICDDSTQAKYIAEIDQFCMKHEKCQLIRRDHHKGFKAGNINHAVIDLDVEWFLLIDADQFLPRDYLTKLVRHIPEGQEHVAFLQAAHKTSQKLETSAFQKALSSEVEFFYSRDLSVRQNYGFVPLLGHGTLIRRSAWKKSGGIPEIVSEDFAFAMRCSTLGMTGQYVEQVESYEIYPYDFGGFLIRLKKFAGGTAELIRKGLFPFLNGEGSFPEKWDMVLMLIWYILMPLLVLNGFLSAYIVNKLWRESLPFLQPILPYLYIWMFLVTASLSVSTTGNWGQAMRFLFWSTAIYTATMPLASMAFVKSLFIKPKFNRTPKNSERTTLRVVDALFMMLLGTGALYCSYIWLSPFSPVLAGQGVAYFCFPLYNQLNSKSALGDLARFIIYIPGALIIFALYTMWVWGR